MSKPKLKARAKLKPKAAPPAARETKATAGSNKAGASKAASDKAGASKAAPSKAGASKAGASKAIPNKTIMESAQHIWLAGLGAFAKAQEEGGRLFETLVREGSGLEQKTRKIATGTVDDVRGAVESGVSQVRERTQETWDRLEQVFENRVSKALGKLGVPARKEIDELMKRVEELNQQVRKLNGNTIRGVGQTIASSARRARDDLSDLARELEEVQLAAKKAAPKRGKR